MVASTAGWAHCYRMQTDQLDLSGKLLIAMPDMGDPRFDRSVIYICEHSPEGAMGLIVNKPRPKIRYVKLLQELEIEVEGIIREKLVHYGGPVERMRGFVLHTDDYETESGTIEIDGGVAMTATVDVLHDIARGNGPRTSLLALGYAGWGPDQLEGEIASNSWLTCDGTQEIVFGEDNDNKWQAALASIGVSPQLLSGTPGHA